jgi:hypothetical protein
MNPVPVKKSILLPVSLFVLLTGLVSAAIITKYNYFIDRRVNIFERTKNECPDIKWIHPVDSGSVARPISIEGELTFAGERVPLEDPDVKERLERELLINVSWRSNTLLDMKLANRYFDDIEKTLIDNGIPADFKYMALIESNFRDEVSPAGAVGFWQFVKGTAKGFNLEVTDEVDERYNTEKATLAACSFLKDAHEKLGNWTLAAASYNLGVPGMMQRMKDQNSSDYYEMYFNPETSRYIFRMLAMKIIFSAPGQAGYKVKPDELYQPYKYKFAEVDSSISSIADFAKQFGLKYKHIKLLNPWLRNAKLINKDHKKYQIKIMEPNS